MSGQRRQQLTAQLATIIRAGERYGKTREEIARKMGLSVSVVGKIVSGNSYRIELKRGEAALAKYWGISDGSR